MTVLGHFSLLSCFNQMDATSNTSETVDDECMRTDRDRQEAEDNVASTTEESLPATTAEENEGLRCCDDVEYKVDVC